MAPHRGFTFPAGIDILNLSPSGRRLGFLFKTPTLLIFLTHPRALRGRDGFQTKRNGGTIPNAGIRDSAPIGAIRGVAGPGDSRGRGDHQR